MQRILFANDLEEGTSDNVAAFALAIADNFGARLTVYHAYGQPHMTLGDDTPEMRRDRVLERLRGQMARLRSESFADVEVVYDADVDYPGDGIMNRAAETDVDLVIIGLRERNEGGEQFSSLSYKLIRETRAAVLAVPPQATFHGIGQIAFATDLDAADEVVLEQLQEWRANMVADLYVVHVYDDAAEKEHARKVLAKWRERYGARARLHFELVEGDFTEDIGDYCRRRGADMLVTQSHVRGFFGRIFGQSDTGDVAQTIDIPLLVMRGQEA